jgi:hypothetical protein
VQVVDLPGTRANRRFAKRRKLTRNALVRMAVGELLEKQTDSQEWSEAVLQWQGDPGFAPFESHRDLHRHAAPPSTPHQSSFERRNRKLSRKGIRDHFSNLNTRRACSGRSVADSGIVP